MKAIVMFMLDGDAVYGVLNDQKIRFFDTVTKSHIETTAENFTVVEVLDVLEA